MTVKFVDGDLFYHKFDAIAHGCNCKGVMGAGIAKTIKEKFPQAFYSYNKACFNGEFTPNTSLPVKCENVIVFNLATQLYPGAEAKYHFIEEALKQMDGQALDMNISTIGMPMIGAGIGGLDPNLIETLIESTLKDSSVEYTIFRNYIPGI